MTQHDMLVFRYQDHSQVKNIVANKFSKRHRISVRIDLLQCNQQFILFHDPGKHQNSNSQTVKKLAPFIRIVWVSRRKKDLRKVLRIYAEQVHQMASNMVVIYLVQAFFGTRGIIHQ